MNEEFNIKEAGRKEKQRDFLLVWILFCFCCGDFCLCLFGCCLWFCSVIAYFLFFAYVGGMAGMRGGHRELRGEQNWSA